LQAASAEEPDVVLLDLGLPGMGGYKVARRLAALCQRKPYLIAVSGFGGDDIRHDDLREPESPPDISPEIGITGTPFPRRRRLR
jgi:CheY-like chemotaxis protein